MATLIAPTIAPGCIHCLEPTVVHKNSDGRNEPRKHTRGDQAGMPTTDCASGPKGGHKCRTCKTFCMPAHMQFHTYKACPFSAGLGEGFALKLIMHNRAREQLERLDQDAEAREKSAKKPRVAGSYQQSHGSRGESAEAQGPPAQPPQPSPPEAPHWRTQPVPVPAEYAASQCLPHAQPARPDHRRQASKRGRELSEQSASRSGRDRDRTDRDPGPRQGSRSGDRSARPRSPDYEPPQFY